MKYVTVEYIVETDDEEKAVEIVRNQLERDDEFGHIHDENRLDYMVRSVS